jgi:amino acid transporter
MNLRSFILGSPLPTAQEEHERLSKTQVLAVFSADALSSVAYATEEILVALLIGGAAALQFSSPIAVVIVLLLAIVVSSYYQTIHGYPSGGGAYTVALDNLGVWPGLIAAAGLLIGCILTVAVSITAGIAALTSAFPVLYTYRVPLALSAILLITWGNLRGVRESGTAFTIPTYVFLLVAFAFLISGGVRILGGVLPDGVGLRNSPGVPEGETLFLILRGFASGCTALTGVEAISNGLPAFRQPEAKNAGQTLIAMALILGTLFLGITFIADQLGVVPKEGQTVVSQLGRLVFGAGPLYLGLQFTTALVLVLAANTSFAGFPRLAAIMAHDRHLPRQLTNLGDRLVYNNGIVALTVLAAALVVLFGGDTHRLIPLYAVGVFLSFTLSQAGMVRHWIRKGDWAGRLKSVVNGVSAAAIGIVMVIIMSAKFVPARWWHHLLHNQTASAIRTALMYQRGQAGEGRIVISVLHYLQP